MRVAKSHHNTLYRQKVNGRMDDYRQPHPLLNPPPQVGHGRVDHHRIITCSEGKSTVAMETPFRNPMIPSAHAAFSLICPNSYRSILRFWFMSAEIQTHNMLPFFFLLIRLYWNDLHDHSEWLVWWLQLQQMTAELQSIECRICIINIISVLLSFVCIS